MTELIISTESGLYCPQGDFYIDPWKPVENAVITHAHSDHLRPDNGKYLLVKENDNLVRTKLGDNLNVELLEYGQKINIKDIEMSFHPAGHILGSSQVRLSYKGEVWVVSGDYKVQPDKTCLPLEPVQCHTFITESTFALPIYQWTDSEIVFGEINKWWLENKEQNLTSILFCYALGKAQRILSGIDQSIGPIYTHGAVEKLTQNYRDNGVILPSTIYVSDVATGTKFAGGLVLAPPSALGSRWLKQFTPYSSGFASGWMRIRGARRRKSVDRGFVLSDHADWQGLLNTIAQTNADRVIVTHGYSAPLVRWLNEAGLKAETFETKFEGEAE